MAEDSSGSDLPHSSSSFSQENVKVVTSLIATKKRKAYDVERGKTRVYLYDQMERWRELKEQLHVDSDKNVAEVLLNTYFSGQAKCASR